MKKAMLFMMCMSMSVLLTMLGVSIIAGCSADKTTLHVYSWSDYFDPELIEKFEADNNCKVVIDTFDSNEAMYAKLKAGASGYDVITPSTYQIPLLVKENMVSPIDHNLISNVCKNFNHDLDNQILDKSFEWSVPYACTYTGIMYLKDKFENVSSWNVFANPNFKGKSSMLDDIRETIGIGLMYNGYSLNSTNKQEIMKAAETIAAWKNNIRKFDAESYKLEVANKSSWFGHGYSSDAAQVIISEGRDDIGFTLPDEGFTVCWDEFVISSSSKNKELSHKFIDFFYDNDNAYNNMIYICTLMANKEAFEKMEDNYKSILMPKNIDKGQLLKGFDDPKVLEYYNKAWDIIKTTK